MESRIVRRNYYASVLFLTEILISLAFFSACSRDSLIGNWRMVRRNNSAQDHWTNGDNESVEFFADGRYGVGGRIRGTFITDTNVLPHRFIIKGDINFRGIYKIEGKKLILKASLLSDQIDFPGDFGIQQYWEVIELERR